MKTLFTRCAIAITLSMGINAIAFASPVPAIAQQASPTSMVTAEQFKKFEGEYQIQPGVVVTIFQKDGQFLTQAPGQQSFEIFAESADTFYAKVADIKIKFVTGSDGMVSHFTLVQNGRTMPPATRVK
jgi:uncharacterized protein YneR